MSDQGPTQTIDDLAIRTFEPDDSERVHWLFEAGRLAGQVSPNDTAADIDNIPHAYLEYDRNHFWVAVHQGRVVGMVGVAEDEPNKAEIRRLRVDPDYRQVGVTIKLMETALSFCHHHGYLKVVLDTQVEEGGESMELFDRFAFQHNRTRNVLGKELLDFYLDLYREPKSEEQSQE